MNHFFIPIAEWTESIGLHFGDTGSFKFSLNSIYS